eukprot:PhF_6_TR40727/c0_g1_i2/m.61268
MILHSRFLRATSSAIHIPYIFKPDWSSEGPLQQNTPPPPPEDNEGSRHHQQLVLLDKAQYYLKGYYLTQAAETLDQARTGAESDPTLQRQLLLDCVLFCKQRRGNLAMEACLKLLRRYPVFAVDPVGRANLGTVFALNQDYSRAIQIFEKVPKDHPVYGDQVASWLAESYSMLGDHAKAEPVIAEVCQTYDALQEEKIQQELAKAKAADDPEDFSLDQHGWTCLRIKNMQLWAGTLMQLDRNEEGVKVMRQAVQEGIRIMGHDDVITAGAKNMLGIGLVRLGLYDEAIQCLEEGTRFLEDRLEEGDDNARTSIQVLMVYCEKVGRHHDALRHAHRYEKMTRLLFPGDPRELGMAALYVCRQQYRCGCYAEAVEG